MNDKQIVKKPRNEVRELLEGPHFRAELAKALPNTLTPDRYVRIILNQTLKNPKILLCSRETLFRCLLDLAAIGIEPDGRNAHLIPRKNKAGGLDCTTVIDYKGLKSLLYRNDDIISEHSDVVGDLDEFSYEFGSRHHLTHRPNTRGRGRIYAAYSYVTLPKGGTVFEVMSIDEIEAIRKRSSNPDGDPWTKDWSEMAKKTVFKRLAKSLPLSPRTRDAIELDNTHEVTIEPVSAKVAGGSQKSLDENFEETAGAVFPDDVQVGPQDEPEPTPPAKPIGKGLTRSQERVSDAGKGKAAQKTGRLREALKQSGFSEAELLAVLAANKVIEHGTTFEALTPNAIEITLDNWPEALESMQDSRKISNPEVQEEFPV